MTWGESWGSSWAASWGDSYVAPPVPIPGDNPVWGESWGGSWGITWGEAVAPVPGYSLPWGNSWGISWDNAWGALGPIPEYTAADVLVEATRTGFFDGYQRAVGSTFYIDSPYELSPYWMKLIGTPPDDWLPLMRDFDPEINRNIIRPPTSADAIRWVETGLEPPGDPNGVFE